MRDKVQNSYLSVSSLLLSPLSLSISLSLCVSPPIANLDWSYSIFLYNQHDPPPPQVHQATSSFPHLKPPLPWLFVPRWWVMPSPLLLSSLPLSAIVWKRRLPPALPVTQSTLSWDTWTTPHSGKWGQGDGTISNPKLDFNSGAIWGDLDGFCRPRKWHLQVMSKPRSSLPYKEILALVYRASHCPLLLKPSHRTFPLRGITLCTIQLCWPQGWPCSEG